MNKRVLAYPDGLNNCTDEQYGINNRSQYFNPFLLKTLGVLDHPYATYDKKTQCENNGCHMNVYGQHYYFGASGFTMRLFM